MIKRLEPLSDFVVLKEQSGEKTISGIIIPNNDTDQGVIAIVVSVGRGIYNFNSDTIVPHQVKEGDVVIMPKLGVQKVSIGNDDFYICQSNQLLARVVEE